MSVNFKREIRPYEGFELWTRVLTWDDKWLFIVGHFVRKGLVEPKGYLLQPWRKVGGTEGKARVENGTGESTGLHPHIFATGIAKYVFKKGRLTIPPERVLRASGLLPPRPTNEEPPPPPTSTTPDPAITSNDIAITSAAATLKPDNADEIIAASLTANDAESEEWTWERVERERKRGLEVAEMYNGLEVLNGEFTGEEQPVLGRY